MAYAISPNFLDTDLPPIMSLEEKIELFYDNVKGWQKKIARQYADKNPHAGFAVLEIVFREALIKYFLPHIKYEAVALPIKGEGKMRLRGTAGAPVSPRQRCLWTPRSELS